MAYFLLKSNTAQQSEEMDSIAYVLLIRCLSGSCVLRNCLYRAYIVLMFCLFMGAVLMFRLCFADPQKPRSQDTN